MRRSLKYRRPPAIEWIISPALQFAKMDAAAGILLIIATALAMIFANTGMAHAYHEVLEVEIAFGLPKLTLFGHSLLFEGSLHHWINDGLMAMFFFVVGLEIKRELLVGELATPAKASLPFAAAFGGMVLPAGLYVLINLNNQEAMHGWGVPMATDIAFAVGVLALLGNRVPNSLKVFLMAVAIVDDIGAVLVIALFYTSDVNTSALWLAGGMLLLMGVLNRIGVRSPLAYLIPGLILWFAFLISGVHATIAGVLAAFMIPVRVKLDEAEFVAKSSNLLGQFQAAQGVSDNIINNQMEQHAVHNLEKACEHVQPPLLRLEHAMYPWVIFFVMPIFALANAGVELGAGVMEALSSTVAIGIAVGLVFGKIIGVAGATWLAVKLGIATLPSGVNWRQLVGVGAMAGIGFTMSLFISGLAFTNADRVTSAKLGILLASLIAGTIGLVILRFFSGSPYQRPEPDRPGMDH